MPMVKKYGGALMKKYRLPVIMLLIFEIVAITLWLTKDNLFYLFNFSYIGMSISLGMFLLIRKYKYARRIVQLLVGLYMLIYLGLICQENMQIEGFWYYLFTGVFEAATIHYAVAKIFGPLIFGRGWCGYACWTAMVLDFLPYNFGAAKEYSGLTEHQLIENVAKATRRMMCEVVADEYGCTIEEKPLDVFTQSGDDRYTNSD